MFHASLYAVVVLLLLNLNILLSPVASAQQNSAIAKKQRADDEQSLKEAPELPNLPAYTGKCKFISAYTNQHGQGWTAYRCDYLAKESMQQVIDWYDKVFKSYGWKIVDERPQSIVAYQLKDGLTCSVHVNEAARSSGYRTQLLVHFGQAPSAPRPAN